METNNLYSSFSLNGTWEMNYDEKPYKDCANPWTMGYAVEDAVPGYWEDMTDKFELAPFFCFLKINPEYGIQQYPIADVAPDMALPNVVGTFFYRRTFLCTDVASADAAIWFSGVQNAASVWVNDAYLGRHEGYSTDFEMAIPAGVLKDGENVIVLAISNHRLEGFAGEPVSGLTSRAANECTGGITGDVELRVYHCPLRDAAVLISEDCSKAEVRITSDADCSFDWTVLDGDTVVKSGTANGDFRFDTDGLQYWSPESPKCYTLQLKCGEYALTRTFGVRRLLVDGVHLRLNGIPCFLRGICEHCYFPMTVHPNHDISFYRNIIKTLKSLGFNFIRFHTYIPAEEYMQAADELGILVQVESPNNTSLEEWKQIVTFCRRHTSVVIYCSGNELQMDWQFIGHLNRCADDVHANTDALYSPMSALRGLTYHWIDEDREDGLVELPRMHNPRKIQKVGEFTDLYNSDMSSILSYESLKSVPAVIDSWSCIYNKPRLSHELCIHGTYTDLSLKDRYKNTRVGRTDMFSSIERHLASKGLLERAPLFFRNSSEWQRRLRKHAFENCRLCEKMAGFDFLGPIDTHWHTFGYDVGMMNEFYELKPGETRRNVLMYNSPTVLLNSLNTDFNFNAGEKANIDILVSHYGTDSLSNAELNIRLTMDGKCIERRRIILDKVENGKVSKLCCFDPILPDVQKPGAMILYVTLESGDTFAENEWELYVFPKNPVSVPENMLVAENISEQDLITALENGKDVVLLGTDLPFESMPTSFRLALAGRTGGNLATVIADHPSLRELPHEGFCGWQFRRLLEGGRAICFENCSVPFHPIIEVASTHKYAIRQSALFEFNALNGRLLVCSFNFTAGDPASCWLRNALIAYAAGEDFEPSDTIGRGELEALIHSKVKAAAENNNIAFNPNDKTAVFKRHKK